MAVSEVLSALSAWTASFLRSTRAGGWDAREETVTEVILEALQREPHGTTRVFKTSTGLESVFGTDFLWAIRQADIWISLWIQCKKASESVPMVYDDLKTPKAKQQVVKLLLNSYSQGAIPCYLLFNPGEEVLADGQLENFGLCSRGDLTIDGHGLPWHDDHTSGGVTLADAAEVARRAIFASPPDRSVASVNDYAMPWECLVCPGRASLGHLPLPPDPGEPDMEVATLPVEPLLGAALDYLTLSAEERELVRTPRGLSAQAARWVVRLQESGSPFADQADLVAPGEQPAFFVITDLTQEDEDPDG